MQATTELRVTLHRLEAFLSTEEPPLPLLTADGTGGPGWLLG